MTSVPVPRAERAERSGVWQAQKIRDLGLHTSVPVAADILGISRSTAYELIRRGEFPVQVLSVGSRKRVSTRALLAFLGVPEGER